jgi:acyl-CoA synthetase (NDP forming)
LAGTAKPVAVLANLASAVDPAEAATLRAAGVPVLEGTATGLAAFGHLFAYRDFLARGGAVDNPAHPRPGPATLPHRGTWRGSAALEAVRERWWARLGEGRPLDELEALALLGDWGIPVVAAEWRPTWRGR